MNTRTVRHAWMIGSTVALVAAVSVVPCVVSAQSSDFEEIVVSFEVQRLLRTDLFVLYNGETIFLPLSETFRLLDLNTKVELTNHLAHGFFVSQNQRYEIDLKGLRARSHRGDFVLQAADFTTTQYELYLKVDRFNDLFGLGLQFDFSMLRVFMKLNTELPAWQKLQRKLTQNKLRRESAALRDVRELPMQRQYLSGGTMDWALSSNPLDKDHYYDVTIGAVALGGDLTVAASGNTVNGLTSDRISPRWHYHVQNNEWITQAELGKVSTSGPLARSFDGGLMTNRPQVQRTYFQTIRLNNYLGEGWEVELYIDNKLTDFMYTNQNGEYDFNIDIVYGSSLITLKMYGPNGELRTEEQFIAIPYNLIPKHAIEYTVAGGSIDQSRESGTFAQGSAYYGVLEYLTMGVATDIPVSTPDSSRVTVAADMTVQPLGNLTINTSFSPENEIGLAVNYSKFSAISLTAEAIRYFENPVRNFLGRDYSLSFAASAPIRVNGRYFGLRYNVLHEARRSVNTTSMSYGFSASLPYVSVSYLGRTKLSSNETRTSAASSSQLIVSPTFIRWIRPQMRIDYDHSRNRISGSALYLSKRLLRAVQATASFERNQLTRSNQVSVSVDLLTDFLGTTSRVTRSDNETRWSQLQRGSIQYDRGGRQVRFERRNQVGYGAAVVRPYLDRNYNGEYDGDDEYLPGLRAKVQGVGGRRMGREGVFYYDRLRAYDNYLVQIDEYSLDNPLLRPTHENFRVTVSPNMVTEIRVPVVMAGEINGAVARRTESGDVGVGGVRVMLYNVSKETVTEVTSFNDGEFYYLGLLPGQYRAYIDPEQVERYGYISVPAQIEFEVAPIDGGAVVSDINFVLTSSPTK